MEKQNIRFVFAYVWVSPRSILIYSRNRSVTSFAPSSARAAVMAPTCPRITDSDVVASGGKWRSELDTNNMGAVWS